MDPLLPPLLIILGPTASGKTNLSLVVAETLGCEIISGDSMQVYRGMDIGTAKLPLAQRRGIPHHLIDILDPDQPFSVADFRAAAITAAQDILSRGRLPLLVGGTGLYISSLLRPYNFAPDSDPDPELRQRLRREYAEKGGPALHQRLAAADPQAALRIHPNDQRRLIRALEVYAASGRTISSMQQIKPEPPPFAPILAGLTLERELLYQRIDLRVEQMLAQGLADEVKGLLEAGLSSSHTSMQAIGYRQLAEYWDGKCGYEEAVANIKRDTRRFAKRQMTWFRREEHVKWFDVAAYHEEGALKKAVCGYLSQQLKGE